MKREKTVLWTETIKELAWIISGQNVKDEDLDIEALQVGSRRRNILVK